MTRKALNMFFIVWYLLSANTTLAYTHADTLRGSNGRGRMWWDVLRYQLSVAIDTDTAKITGTNVISLVVTRQPADSMQIDLQGSLSIDNVTCEGEKMPFAREGAVWWVKYPFHLWLPNSVHAISINYSGTPRQAINPPWDGGFSRMHDSAGHGWLAVSCQGLGASAWWPCKDAQWDEPDSGMDINLTVPSRYAAISNGRLIDTLRQDAQHTTWHWQVKNPINNYDVTFYIGDYVHWHDTLMGEKGKLDLDFWVLRQNEEKARKQFAVVKQMLHCFEYWLGPYPFYEDGYKLADAPYLGMEHQSAVAYGNQYKMGYLDYDRSETGIGLQFDYIIVHESGHEWFGNSITARDIADNWIHEGITTYSESLFVECSQGKEKGEKYCRGERHNIQNDKTIIGDYGVNNEGAEDMYDKGAAIMYMIRIMTGDDEKFRNMLRGLSATFYHQQVTTAEVEDYIAAHTGLDLHAFFNQYLRTTKIPTLEYSINNKILRYRFTNIVDGLVLPIAISSRRANATLHPTADWQTMKWIGGYNIKFSDDFLINAIK